MDVFAKATGTFRLFIVLFLFVSGCSVLNDYYPSAPPREFTGRLAVHFIDVGEGDSTLILLDSGENILVDAGGPSAGPDVVKYLKGLGVEKINYLIFTHPHDDHIGGIVSILSAFDVDHFYDNGFSNFSSIIFRDYVARVRRGLSRYKILKAGEKFAVGRVEIDVLNPLLPPSGSINEDSIVLRIHAGDIRIFLAGDMGQLGERRLLNIGEEMTSNVIKVGHHGDNDSCSREFLAKVRPEAAVISVGKINKYARPHAELLSRLIEAGVKIYRTDLQGNIVLRTDGRTYSINAVNEREYR